MVRRSTWIVLGLFVVLVGFAVIIQRYQANKTDNTATATPTAPPVFLYNLGDVKIVDIKIANNTGKYIDLYRDPSSSNWAIDGVPADQVDSSQIEALNAQLLGLQVQETLTETLSLSAIGLETPAYTITLTTSTASKLITYVGMQTAIGTGYYVRDSNGKVMIVEKMSLDTILNVLTTPPILPTATPEITPLGTVSPTVPANLETPTP